MSKDAYFHIRLTRGELEAFRAKAVSLGMNPSDLMRSLMLITVLDSSQKDDASDRIGSIQVVAYDVQTITQAKQQIRRWGHHYNQGIRALNTIASKGFMRADEQEEYLQKALSFLTDVNTNAESIASSLSDIANASQQRLFFCTGSKISTRNEELHVVS